MDQANDVLLHLQSKEITMGVASDFILGMLSFVRCPRKLWIQGHPGELNFLDVGLYILNESHFHPWESQGKASGPSPVDGKAPDQASVT